MIFLSILIVLALDQVLLSEKDDLQDIMQKTADYTNEHSKEKSLMDKIKAILITIGVISTLPFWVVCVIIIVLDTKDWEPEGDWEYNG